MGAESERAPQEGPGADVRVGWAPLPGSQTLFLTCPVHEALYEGTRGPGKTETLLADFAQHCGRGYGQNWRGVLFRQTYKQLADAVIKSSRMFRECFPGARFNRSSYVWHFPDGEELLLRSARIPDDYWDYHGHEYPWVGWEELTSWPDSRLYLTMMSCNRSSFQGMPRKYRSTTNPFGVGFRWVKERFITPAPRGTIITESNNSRVAVHGHLSENPYLLRADPGYVDRLNAITDPNVRKAWRDGSWDINAGGAVDDVWDEKVHLIEPFPIPSHWPVHRSFDWGAARPFSVGWHAISPGEDVRMADGNSRWIPAGTAIRVAEYYGSSGAPNVGLNLSNAEVAQRIRQKEQVMPWAKQIRAGAADSAIYEGSNGFERTIARDMEKEGVYFLPASKGPGSRRRRLQLLRSALAAGRTKGPLEKPALFAFNVCREFRRQIPDLPRDPKDPECVDTDAEDHLFDELTYQLSMNSQMTTAFNVVQ